MAPPPRPRWTADHRVPIPAHPVDGDQDRCFLIELPPGALTGYDLQANGLVHHALLGLYPESVRPLLQDRDAADPGPGWDCPDAFMARADPAPERVPVRWFPNPEPTRLTPGTGVPLTRTAVLQVHGLGVGTAEGTLELKLAPLDAVLPQTDLVLGRGDIALPDDGSEHVVQQKAYVGSLLDGELPGDGPVWVVGARGHGHDRLARLTLALDDAPVLDLVRYDPRIQPRYRLARPVPAPRDAVLSLTCTYRDADRDAVYGEQAGEMCGGWVWVVGERP